jgi:hypothetical protein
MADGAQPMPPEAQPGPQQAQEAPAQGSSGSDKVQQVIGNVNDGIALIGEIFNSVGAAENHIRALAEVQARFQEVVTDVAKGMQRGESSFAAEQNNAVQMSGPGESKPLNPAGV